MDISSLDHSETPAERVPLRELWRQIETPAMWFLLLNCLDAGMTYILLHLPRQHEEGLYAVESNRLAAYFLNHWGIQGLFAFKLVMALFVCVIGLIIATRNVDMARRMFAMGTFIIAAVVIYSVWLARGLLYG